MPTIQFEPVTYAHFFSRAGVSVDTAQRFSEVGQIFHIFAPGATIYGAYLYTHKSGPHTIRLKLWRPGDATVVRTQDFSFGGAGYYQCLWDEPYAVTLSDLQKEVFTPANQWILGQYDPDQVGHTANVVGLPDTGAYCIGWYGTPQQNSTLRYNLAGEGRPNTAWGACLPISPLVAPPEQGPIYYEPTPWAHSYGGPDRAGIEAGSGNRTTGGSFLLWYRAKVHGVRFYTAAVGEELAVKASLWKTTSPTPLATVTQGVLGPGYYDFLFASPYEITTSDMTYETYIVGVYETTGQYETRAPAVHPWEARRWSWYALAKPSTDPFMTYYATGDARPNTGGTYAYPVAPLVEPLFVGLV